MPRAKRRCAQPDCSNYHPCTAHPWGWQGSSSPPLPSNWQSLKKKIKKDGCAHRSGGCDGKLELDHIIPRSRGGTDHPSNLQWLCKRHHRLKTEAERKQK